MSTSLKHSPAPTLMGIMAAVRPAARRRATPEQGASMTTADAYSHGKSPQAPETGRFRMPLPCV